MNVFLRELVAYRKSTIIWAVSLAAMVFVFMVGMYPTFTSDLEASRAIISQLPPAVLAAFSISLSNFFTIFGFYAYFLSFATVAGAIQAMNVGTGVMSKEFSGKTADFLLSKPVRRSTVLTAKLAAALVSVVVVALTFSAIGYAGALIAEKQSFSAGTFLLLSLTMLFVQLFFFALGALFSVVIPKIKSVVSVSLPTVFTFFIIGTLGELVGNEEVRYLTPFKYFDSLYIINKQAYETRYLAVEAVLVLVFIVATYVVLQKKNVRASA